MQSVTGHSANLGICPVNFSTKILAAMNAFERMSEHFQWLAISTDDVFMKLVLVSRMFHNKKLASNMNAMLFVTRFLKTAKCDHFFISPLVTSVDCGLH